MTLSTDTRPSAPTGLLTDLLGVLRNRLRPTAVPPVAPADALVRALCHDMRSPLAALQSVLDHLDTDTHPQLVQLAREQASQLSSMLRTADATGGAPERRGLRRLGDVVRASVAASGLPPEQLRVEIAGDACDVAVADARVQRILTNLLENAHRHGGGAPVGLRVARRADWVDLALTQAGVPTDRVLGHLTRSEPPVDLTGLGLWSVQRQTRELGGRLAWCTDDDGAFTLVVRLPDR
ncbi:sensor histidine kinase [Modestobacter sp. URMC 112]